MKILFLTTLDFRRFPTYKRAVGTGEMLARSGHRVAIMALDCEENRCRIAREAPHCEVLWFRNGGCIAEVLIKIIMIWRWRPDIVYSTAYSPRNLAFLRFCLPRSMKVVVEFSELYSQYGETQRWWKLVERYAVLENTHIVAASRLIAQRFETLAKKMRCSTLVLYSPYAYPDYLKSLGNHSSRKAIVFMASLYKNYGVFDVIDACSSVMRIRKDVDLEIIGGGPEKECAQRRVKELGLERRIHIHGYVPESELNDLFSCASVFVAPMHDNVQDNVRCPSKVYYYIPYNKPIVTCKISEPYAALGEFGYYYRPDDVVDMSRVLMKALDDSETFSYPNGFSEKHSWATRASQFIDWIGGVK